MNAIRILLLTVAMAAFAAAYYFELHQYLTFENIEAAKNDLTKHTVLT